LKGDYPSGEVLANGEARLSGVLFSFPEGVLRHVVVERLIDGISEWN
jgi:hypothetical protein